MSIFDRFKNVPQNTQYSQNMQNEWACNNIANFANIAEENLDGESIREERDDEFFERVQEVKKLRAVKCRNCFHFIWPKAKGKVGRCHLLNESIRWDSYCINYSDTLGDIYAGR